MAIKSLLLNRLDLSMDKVDTNFHENIFSWKRVNFLMLFTPNTMIQVNKAYSLVMTCKSIPVLSFKKLSVTPSNVSISLDILTFDAPG